MSRAQRDPLAEIWSRIVEAAARELSAAMFGTPSAGRKREPRHLRTPLGESLPDPYVTLGVLPSAPRAVIEAAYRVLAKTAHPDVGGSAARMRDLTWAMTAIRKERGWKR
jgi:hypothetical protein